MSEQIGEHGLVIAFICNHCAYVQAIGDRLGGDSKALIEGGINVLAVMSNDYRYVPSDGPAHMKQFTAHFGVSFPYLVDEDQQVRRAYGAVCTPDFFGFNTNGELQYRGCLDDAGMGSMQSKRNPELLNAMHQVIKTGKGPQTQFPSMGCSIKWS